MPKTCEAKILEREKKNKNYRAVSLKFYVQFLFMEFDYFQVAHGFVRYQAPTGNQLMRA